MKHMFVKIAAVGLFAVVLTVTPTSTFAAGTNAAVIENRAMPFHGKVTAVDAAAMTVNVGPRTFKVTPETKVTLNGAPAKLADAAVGDNVGGACHKADGGELTATTLNFNTEKKETVKTSTKKEGGM
jgi:hypothetical protein